MKRYYIRRLKNVEEFAPKMGGKIYKGVRYREYIKIYEPNGEKVLFLHNEVIEIIDKGLRL